MEHSLNEKSVYVQEGISKWKVKVLLHLIYMHGSARLLAAIAVEYGCPLLKTDTRQAFLYGEMEEGEKVYIRPPDWWPEPTLEGHVLLLLKSMYGTKQAARR